LWAREALELLKHPAVYGLQTTLLGGSQLVGDLECRQLVEAARDSLQVRFELRGSGRQRRLGSFVVAQMLEW
jgi:hypothetical protein